MLCIQSDLQIFSPSLFIAVFFIGGVSAASSCFQVICLEFVIDSLALLCSFQPPPCSKSFFSMQLHSSRTGAGTGLELTRAKKDQARASPMYVVQKWLQALIAPGQIGAQLRLGFIFCCRIKFYTSLTWAHGLCWIGYCIVTCLIYSLFSS